MVVARGVKIPGITFPTFFWCLSANRLGDENLIGMAVNFDLQLKTGVLCVGPKRFDMMFPSTL